MKSFKSISIFLLLFMSINFINAQDCKPFFSGTDPYTNEKFVLYGGLASKSGAGKVLMGADDVGLVNFALGYKNDTIPIVWVMLTKYFTKDAVATVKDYKIEKGEKLYINTSNGGFILESIEEVTSTSKTDIASSSQVQIQAVYAVTKEQAQKIAESNLQNIMLKISNASAVKVELAEKTILKFKEYYRCYLLDSNFLRLK